MQNSAKAEPCTGDSLVLYLNMKNLSSDYSFAPLDNYFDRYWKTGMDLLPPDASWRPGPTLDFTAGRLAGIRAEPRTSDANGSRDARRSTRSCSIQARRKSSSSARMARIRRRNSFFSARTEGTRVREPYRGRFLWRIRVRRGLVRIKDKDYSATAVVGVEFSDKDIQ